MATKRKLTLADVTGPGDQAKVDARGSVRPARERIRPQRYLPPRELLDFRGLSRTITAAAQVITAEVERADLDAARDDEDIGRENFERWGVARDDFKEQLAGTDPIVVPDLPPLAGKGKPPKVTGDPQLDHRAPTGLPNHLEAARAEIAAGARAGEISTPQNPLARNLSGRNRGYMVAADTVTVMRTQDMFHMTQWDTKTQQAVMDFDTRFRDRIGLGMEQLEGDQRAQDAYLDQMMLEYSKLKAVRDLTLDENATKTEVNQVHIPNFTAKVRGALNPEDRNDDTEVKKGVRIQRTADILTLELDEVQRSGIKVDPAEFAFTAMRTSLETAAFEHRDNAFELEQQIDERIEAFAKVRVGKALASQSTFFQRLVDTAETLKRAGAGSSRVGDDSIDRLLMDAGAEGLEKILGTFTDDDARNNLKDIDAGRAMFIQLTDEKAKALNLTGGQLVKFKAQRNELLARQEAKARLGGSSAAVEEAILQQKMLGNDVIAEQHLHDAFRAGQINPKQATALRGQMNDIEQAAEFKRPGSAMFVAGEELKHIRNSVVSLKLGAQQTAEMLAELDRMERSFNSHFNSAISTGRRADQDGNAAGAAFMQGAGSTMMQAIRENFGKRVTDVETIRSEFEEMTNTGKRFSDEDRQRLREKLGPGAQPIISNNNSRTRLGTAWGRNTPIIQESQGLLTDTVAGIAQVLAEGDEGLQNLLERRAITGHSTMVNAILEDLSSTGHANFDTEFRAQMEKGRAKLESELRKFVVDQNLKNEAVRTISQEDFTSDELENAKAQGDRELYQSKADNVLNQLHSRIRTQLGVEGRAAFSNYLTSLRFGTKAEKAAAVKRWFGSEDPLSPAFPGVLSLAGAPGQLNAFLRKNFKDSTITGEEAAQLEYDIRAVAGAFTIEKIERDLKQAGEEGLSYDPRGMSVPLFRDSDHLREFTLDSERFYAIAETLGFTELDEKVAPIDNPVVLRWFEFQMDKLQQLGLK